MNMPIAPTGLVVFMCGCLPVWSQAQLSTFNQDSMPINGAGFLTYDTARHVLYGNSSWADWNGETNFIWQWQAVGGFSSVGSGLLQATAMGLEMYQGDLYFSGNFNGWSGGYDIDYLARWDGTFWHPSGEPNGGVGLFKGAGTLWCNGGFDSIGGIPIAGHLARLVDGTWEAFGSPPPNENNTFLAAALYQGEYHLGGNLLPPWIAEDVLKWDGAEWQSVGGGLQSSPLGEVTAMQEYGGRLIVAGYITSPPDPGKSVICWNGSSWNGFFPELVTNMSPWCRDLEIIDGKLYMTGSWVFAGDDRVYAVLVYDGTTLCGVGSTSIAEYGHGYNITGNADSIFFGTSAYILSGDTVNHYAVWPTANGPDTCVTIPTSMREEPGTTNVLAVWPNPAVDELTVELPGDSHVQIDITVIDAIGRNVLRQSRVVQGQQKLSLDIHELMAGTYFGHIEGMETWRFRFVKR